MCGRASPARAAAGESRPGAGTVDHVGSLLVPDDQVVFSVIRAESVELVLEVNERAGLPVDRVAPVTSHGFRMDTRRRGNRMKAAHSCGSGGRARLPAR